MFSILTVKTSSNFLHRKRIIFYLRSYFTKEFCAIKFFIKKYSLPFIPFVSELHISHSVLRMEQETVLLFWFTHMRGQVTH